jgi:hypothetical protein
MNAKDQRGFIFSLDATLAMLVVMIVMAGVARAAGPSLIYEQHGFLRLERYANDALTVMDTLGISENIVRTVEYGDIAGAEDTARMWLRKILPEDVQFKFVFGDDMLTVYPTDATGWDSVFSTVEEVATAVRMATYWDGTSWSIQTIDSAGNTGQHTSIALDASGYPHISYYSAPPSDNLKYARWTGFDWAVWVIQYPGDVGKYTSIALDNRGYAHISYFYDTDDDLRYAYWTGDGWAYRGTSWGVDTSGNVGQYTSIALDNNGYAHISYYDYTNRDLKYARWTGSSWVRQSIDNTGDVGSYTSIALDKNQNPHISYYDNTNGNLKYARLTGAAWSIQTVDSPDNVGQYTSIALGENGNPHISYYDVTYGDLKYAYWTGNSWSIQRVDFASNVGLYTSIDLDGNGNPHISYYADGLNDLKYAWWDGRSWRIRTVDSAGNVGMYTSIALLPRGYPHISYYDSTNGNLKYARSLWEFVPIKLYVWRGPSI